MAKHDVTKLNVAIDRLLETTTNPRHRTEGFDTLDLKGAKTLLDALAA